MANFVRGCFVKKNNTLSMPCDLVYPSIKYTFAALSSIAQLS